MINNNLSDIIKYANDYFGPIIESRLNHEIFNIYNFKCFNDYNDNIEISYKQEIQFNQIYDSQVTIYIIIIHFYTHGTFIIIKIVCL